LEGMAVSDSITEEQKVITVRLSDEDITKLAEAVMSEFTKQFQINVGKGVLEYLWKAFLALCLVVLLWYYKTGGSK
jgi:hypothetical protein